MQGIRTRLRSGYELARQTLSEFARHRGKLLAAALAFHTLIAMAPLVIVAVATAGIVLGRGAAHEEMTRVLHDTVGEQGASIVDDWVSQASQGGEVASVVGIALMVWAASKLGTRLREALNQIWDIHADALIPGLRTLLRRRLVAFALAVSAGPILLVIFASRALLTALNDVWFGSAPGLGLLIQLLQVALSLVLVAALFMLVFRHVPDTTVSWSAAWSGSVLTSLLFNVGNAAAGIYLGSASTAPYGAAASVLVILLWLHFSAHIFLIGAEFTQIHARRSAPASTGRARPDAGHPTAHDGSRRQAHDQREHLLPIFGRHAQKHHGDHRK
jgi:membrane protein